MLLCFDMVCRVHAYRILKNFTQLTLESRVSAEVDGPCPNLFFVLVPSVVEFLHNVEGKNVIAVTSEFSERAQILASIITAGDPHSDSREVRQRIVQISGDPNPQDHAWMNNPELMPGSGQPVRAESTGSRGDIRICANCGVSGIAVTKILHETQFINSTRTNIPTYIFRSKSLKAINTGRQCICFMQALTWQGCPSRSPPKNSSRCSYVTEWCFAFP